MFQPRRVALWLLLCLAAHPLADHKQARLLEAEQPGGKIAAPPRVHTASLSPGAENLGVAVVADEVLSDVLSEEPYLLGQFLVAPPAGRTLAWVASSTGGEVLSEAGLSGYGVVTGTSIRALAATGARVAPLGRTVGAGKMARTTTTTTTTPPAPPRLPPPSWHLDNLGVPRDTADWEPWVVAVLDSGVAYETQGRFAVAPGMAGVQWVAPLDLIELDGHPNDDHQHGTHIASLIASEGTYRGVVPGVSIMPIKVLDATNRGNEWALVEGIHHAIDHGADVINLSLSFPLGYVPSTALLDALTLAWEADVVVVAAAGNNGARELTWPAASRLVVSVGAAGVQSVGENIQTAYTNCSPKLDILAPGGEIGADRNADGWIDGILAETIDPADPARMGLWFYQGSSQATALISGLSVRLLASGVGPHDIAATLQQSAAGGFNPTDAKYTGSGADHAKLAPALANPRSHRDLYAGLLPFLADSKGNASPRARVTVIDGQGTPVSGASVLGSIYSMGGIAYPICTTDTHGSCDLLTPSSLSSDSAWAFRADAVVKDGVAERPGRAMWTSEGAAALLDALSTTEGWDVLAVYWPGGRDPVLGQTLEGWAVIDLGMGSSSSPLALLFRPSHVTALATLGTLSVDVDGTGLLSSPLGTQLSMKTLTIGTGLLSSPLGFRTTLVGIDGSGLLSSPLGFHATQLYTSGSGLLSSPLGYSGGILLDRGTMLGSGSGDGYELLLGGLVTQTADGADMGLSLVASGALDVGLAEAPDSVSASGDTSAVLYTP